MSGQQSELSDAVGNFGVVLFMVIEKFLIGLLSLEKISGNMVMFLCLLCCLHEQS